MTSILIKPESGLSVMASTTNVDSASKDYMLYDEPYLDTVFTGNPAIALDRGASNAGLPFDTIAFVNSTFTDTATYTVSYSNASDFSTGTTTIGPFTSGIGTVNSARRRAHVIRISFPITTRYVRINCSGASAFTLGRIFLGTRLEATGFTVDAERTFDDLSDLGQFGAFTAIDDYGTVTGWKGEIKMASETFFRTSWQPFLMSVGTSSNFLMIPRIESVNDTQSDWCYGKFNNAPRGIRAGVNNWTVAFQMKGIYA